MYLLAISILVFITLDHRVSFYGTGWKRLSFAAGMASVAAILLFLALIAPL